MELSLALGGGGAKGNAHLGVLRSLDQNGFKVKAIAGTSSGGAYGAFYAAGYYPDEIIQRLSGWDQSKLFGRQPGDGPSLLGFAGLSQLLHDFLGERTFDQLLIPLALTAVDITSGKQVIMREGKIVDALLASMAFPGIFPPRKWNEYTLVDGGVLDNVPVRLARSLAPAIPVIAVVLSLPIEETTKVISPLDHIPPNPVLSQIARMRVTQAFNIFLNSIEISSNQLVEIRLKIDQPDVIIRPAVNHIGLLDKVDIADLARLGEEAAENNLQKIQNALKPRQQLKRHLKRLFQQGFYKND